MDTTRHARMAVAALAAAAALAGCGADDGDDSGSTAGAPPRVEGEAAAPAPDGAGSDGAGSGQADRDDTGGTGGQIQVDPGYVIYTGEIALRVADVDAAAREVTRLADRYGGFVGGDRRTTSEHEAFATILLRIPSERFTAAVESLSGIGDEEWRDIETEDVRTEVVDLRSRIATAQASVDRTRDLLQQAESITEIVTVEAELTKREEALGRLQARERELADLTALSTIAVTLLGPDTIVDIASDGPELGFLAGLGAGWNALISAMTVLVTVVGALLPWLAAAALPTAAVVWWARRRRRVARPLPEGARPAA
jgi:hypothetical protein